MQWACKLGCGYPAGCRRFLLLSARVACRYCKTPLTIASLMEYVMYASH